MKKVLSMLLAATMLLSALAGCGSEPAPAPESENPSEAAPSQEAPKEENNADSVKASYLEGADKVVVNEDSETFTDANGEEMTVKKHPEKPAILYASFTTLWYEAGGKAMGVIGGDTSVDLYNEYIGRDITKDEGVNVLATSGSGKKWDVETIIASQPDLIIVSTAMSGYATIKEPANAASIPVIAVDYDNFSDYLKWFKVFCNLTGNPDLWESVALKSLDEVVATVSSVPTENNPKVFSMFSGSKSLQANTANTVVGGMINELGASNIVDAWENPESATRLDINLETVVAADPDIILVQCHAGAEDAEAQVKEIYGENEVWNSLRAVKEGKVFYLEKALFHNKPNSRFSEAYKVMSDILYPAA